MLDQWLTRARRPAAPGREQVEAARIGLPWPSRKLSRGKPSRVVQWQRLLYREIRAGGPLAEGITTQPPSSWQLGVRGSDVELHDLEQVSVKRESAAADSSLGPRVKRQTAHFFKKKCSWSGAYPLHCACLHALKTVDVPQLQFIVKVANIPVVAQRQISTVQTFQRTMEIPVLQYIDKMVDVLVVQASQVQVVVETVEIPELQFVEKIVVIPDVLTVQGTQTSESLGTALVRQVAQAEIVEVWRLERLILPEKITWSSS